MKKYDVLLVCLLLMAMLSACTGKVIYSEQVDVPKEGWGAENPFTFDVDANDVDTTCGYDILVTMRHSEAFPTQNMWFFVEESDGENKSCDTIQCFTVDNYGHWIGSGVGSLHNISVYYKENYIFPHRGIYHYMVHHGMRYQILEGVKNVGIRVERHKDSK